MKFKTQAFPQYVFSVAFDEKDCSFKKTVKEIRIQDLPSNENKINSRVQKKVHNYMSLKCKARIA